MAAGACTGPFVVEFCGLPGAGKTRLANLVATHSARGRLACIGREAVGQQAITRYSGPGGLGSLARCLIRSLVAPRLGAASLVCASSTGLARPVLRRLVRSSHFLAYSRDVLTLRNVPPAVLDEWIIHELTLCAVFADVQGLGAVAEAIFALWQPSLVVWCDVSPLTAAERVHSRRSASELDGTPISELVQMFERAHEVLKETILPKLSRVSVIRVEGERTAETAFNQIIASFQQPLAGTPARPDGACA